MITVIVSDLLVIAVMAGAAVAMAVRLERPTRTAVARRRARRRARHALRRAERMPVPVWQPDEQPTVQLPTIRH